MPNLYMIEALKTYCLAIVDFTTEEIDVLEEYFEAVSIRKKEMLLHSGDVCDFIGFVTKGCIRHFHYRDGEEITCDITFEHAFFTEFNSFNLGTKSQIAFQAIEPTTLLVIKKQQLLALYESHPKFEELGRKIAENVAVRTTEIAMSLAADKPEKRYENLLREQPEIFQRIPQKYIATILGIQPESLSRIRKRVLTHLKS